MFCTVLCNMCFYNNKNIIIQLIKNLLIACQLRRLNFSEIYGLFTFLVLIIYIYIYMKLNNLLDEDEKFPNVKSEIV